MKGNERYGKDYLPGLAGVILVAVCCIAPEHKDPQDEHDLFREP